MIDTRLILVNGISGAGKSTTAREISRQLQANSIPHRWLHEECSNHPLRITKRCPDDANCDDVAAYVDWSILHWERFTTLVASEGPLHVVDGYVFQSTILNMINDEEPIEAIRLFFDRLMATIAPLQPLLVFLRKRDLRASFESAWRTRGDWWKRISIDIPDKVPFSGDEIASYEERGLRDWERIQRIYQELVRSASIDTLPIDTTACEWPVYHRQICDRLQLPYYGAITATDGATDPAIIGTYMDPDEGSRRIRVKSVDGKTYCESFWPLMELVPVGPMQFEILSFPILLRFAQNPGTGQMRVAVSGGYDWDLDGRTLVRVVSPEEGNR